MTNAAPRRVVALAIALVAAAGAIAAVAAVTGHDDSAEPGDQRVVATRELTWEPAVVQIEAGSAGLLVENRDMFLHDLTIDGVVRLEVPGGRTRRTQLQLRPGTYAFRCTLHPGMDGTLEVRKPEPTA